MIKRRLYMREYMRRQYRKNKEKHIQQVIKWQEQHPWNVTLQRIRRRCNNPKTTTYAWYGGKGIKCTLTNKQIKFLWDRDIAYRMKQPSIDRLDSTKHYTIKNCRFIEMKDNQQGRWSKCTNS
jgi:hypothetical protein